MSRRRLKALVKGLNHLRCQMIPKKRRRKITRDHLLRSVAVLKKTAGGIASLVAIREPEISQEVNRTTFTYTFDHIGWRQSLERDGSYILPPGCRGDSPGRMQKQAQALWAWYMQLTHVEEAFKTLKSDLHLRPIHHQLEHRVKAHILVAFLGYCLPGDVSSQTSAARPRPQPHRRWRAWARSNWWTCTFRRRTAGH